MVKLHLQITDDNERWGNKIPINMFAYAITRNFSKFEIFGSSIPELGLQNREYISTADLQNVDLAVRDHSICPIFLSKQINDRKLSTIVLETNGVWYPHFKSHRLHFATKMERKLVGHELNVGDESLVVNLRAGETLGRPNKHVDYGMLPITYYLDKAMHTGLNPIFIGQIIPSSYIDKLQKAFPDSEFIDPGVKAAFATMFFAKNKVICLSSFSWFAAYLGVSNASIHIPVLGFYNPLQRPDMNWLPYDDPRYSFDYFSMDKIRVTDLTGFRKLKRSTARLKSQIKKIL